MRWVVSACRRSCPERRVDELALSNAMAEIDAFLDKPARFRRVPVFVYFLSRRVRHKHVQSLIGSRGHLDGLGAHDSMASETLLGCPHARMDPVVARDPCFSWLHGPDELPVGRGRLDIHPPAHLFHEPREIALAPIDAAISGLHHVVGRSIQVFLGRDLSDVRPGAAWVGPSVVPLKTRFPCRRCVVSLRCRGRPSCTAVDRCDPDSGGRVDGARRRRQRTCVHPVCRLSELLAFYDDGKPEGEKEAEGRKPSGTREDRSGSSRAHARPQYAMRASRSRRAPPRKPCRPNAPGGRGPELGSRPPRLRPTLTNGLRFVKAHLGAVPAQTPEAPRADPGRVFRSVPCLGTGFRWRCREAGKAGEARSGQEGHARRQPTSMAWPAGRDRRARQIATGAVALVILPIPGLGPGSWPRPAQTRFFPPDAAQRRPSLSGWMRPCIHAGTVHHARQGRL